MRPLPLAAAAFLLLLAAPRCQARDEARLKTAFAAAEAAASQGDGDAAMSAADAALVSFERDFGPGDPRTLAAVGRHAYYAELAGRKNIAGADLRRLLAAPPTQESLVEAAHLLRFTGRFDEALAAARRARALSPEDIEAAQEEAEALIALDRKSEGIVLLSSAAARAPDAYWLQIRLAQLYRMTGLYEQSQKIYERARKAAPGQEPTIAEGYSRLFNGDGAGAIDDFAALAASSPTDPVPLHHWAQALYQTGRLEEAIAKFRETRRLFEAEKRVDVDYVHTLNNMSVVYKAAGRREEALEGARAALGVLEARPLPYWTWEVAGQLLSLRGGDAARVARLAKRALERCAGRACAAADEFNLQLVLARAAIQSGEQREAVRRADKAFALLEPFQPARRGDCALRAYGLEHAAQVYELYERQDKAARAYALAAGDADCMPSPPAAARVQLQVSGFSCRAADRAGEERALKEALRLAREGSEEAQAAASRLARLASGAQDPCPLFSPPDPAPLDLDGAFAAAESASEAGDDTGALRAADAAVGEIEREVGRRDARALTAVGMRGHYAVRAGRKRQVEADLRRLEASGKQEGLVEKARLLREANRPAEALETARRAEALRPRDRAALKEVAEALVMLGRTEEAIVLLSSAAARAPDAYAVESRLGQLYRMTGRYEEALKVYERARRHSPRRGLSIAEGYTRLAAGDGQGAVEEFAALAASSPTDPIPLHHWAQSLFDLERYDESVAKFEQARRLFESQGRADGADYLHTLDHLTLAYVRAGRRPDAVAAERAALNVLEKRPNRYWLCEIGDRLLGLGESVEAVRALAKSSLAACASGSCPPLEEAGLRLLAARGARKLGPREEALDQASRVLAVLEPFRPIRQGDCSERARQLLATGALFESLGRKSEAARAFGLAESGSACMARPLGSAAVHLAASEFWCRAGDRGEQEKALRAARRLLRADAKEARAADRKLAGLASGAAPSCDPLTPTSE